MTSSEGYRSTLPVSSLAQIVPGLLVYRFTHSMYYANSQLLLEQVLFLINGARPPPRWFCIDAGAVDDLDFSAAETLRTIAGLLKERGIRMVFAVVSENVRQEMQRSELTRLVGEDAYFHTVDEVVNAYREKTGSP